MSFFLKIAILIFFYMSFWFLLAILRKRNDLADIAWGLGFVIVAFLSLMEKNFSSLRSIIVFVLVFLWGLRLSTHIFLRNKGKKEDFRYKNWREKWGKNWVLKTYFQVFLLQGVFLFIISLPISFLGVFEGYQSLNLLDFIGIFIWTIGFLFEIIADYQLLIFKSDPKNKGKIMDKGLWQYSRHPNYFGEVTLWWGIFIICINVKNGFLSIIGPLTISFLILKVSGIPLLEAKYQGNKLFEEYKRKTSAFFPLPPKQ
ncbi:MAG: DUF1295 domain-containing protein [Microgenomates group bacterium]|nr:DUF1295 domain-containing protein [Microgenomates group bacterium]